MELYHAMTCFIGYWQEFVRLNSSLPFVKVNSTPDGNLLLQMTEESGTENSMLTFSREWAILTSETGALPANGQSPYSVTEVTACLGAGRLLLFIRLQKQTTNTNDNKTKLQYFGCTH